MTATTETVEILPIKLSRDLIDRGGGFHVLQICETLGVEPAEFARLSGRSTESVAKLFRKESVQPRSEQTRAALREMTQLVTILRAMELEDEAPRWMHTPLPGFAGKTPLELIEEGRGQELVSRLIANATGNVGS
jgi:hypothetical protein